jgi:hypothetical protein
MEERTSRLESAVAQLQLTVQTLQKRLDALEARDFARANATTEAAAEASTEAAHAAAPVRRRVKDQYDPIAILSLAGRLLLVLAGGFFLRAITEAGTLSEPIGVSLAFAYAAVWLFMADRAGGRGLVPSAVSHALGATMVAFPLTLEATTRFKVLTGTSSALVIAVMTTALLFVAWRRRLRAVAWIAVIATLPISAILLIQTGVIVPFTVYLIALGVATLWLTYSIDWWGLRWPVALAADIAVAGVTLRAFSPEHRDAPEIAAALQLLLLFSYFGTTAYRTLIRGLGVSRFEIVQTTAALVVSLGGGYFMAQSIAANPALVGLSALLVGMACYGVALSAIAWREGDHLNFYYYTTLGLTLVLAGFALTGGGASIGAVFAVLAALAAFLWARFGRLYMLLHAAAYLVAAGIVSGAFAYGVRTIVAADEGAWLLPDAVLVLMLVSSALSAAFASKRPTSEDGEFSVGLRFIVILVCAWTVGGVLIGYVAPVAGRMADGSVDPGVLATARTAVLSLSTILIAWMGRHARLREWGWLVYPLLVGIGFKLMTQDFKQSRPATLFIALALFGAALIVAPRLRRRVEKAAAPPAA